MCACCVGRVWVMAGWPSQAHELLVIHAGAYSMFIYGTVMHASVTLCVGVNVCVCTCCDP